MSEAQQSKHLSNSSEPRRAFILRRFPRKEWKTLISPRASLRAQHHVITSETRIVVQQTAGVIEPDPDPGPLVFNCARCFVEIGRCSMFKRTEMIAHAATYQRPVSVRRAAPWTFVERYRDGLAYITVRGTGRLYCEDCAKSSYRQKEKKDKSVTRFDHTPNQFIAAARVFTATIGSYSCVF
jgi:hypothetical protein